MKLDRCFRRHKRSKSRRHKGTFAFCLLPFVLNVVAARGQPVFSIDFQGPTVGLVDPHTGVAITEGDLLMVAPSGIPSPGPVARPRIIVFGGSNAGGQPHLGLAAYPDAVGHGAGVAGLIEVDALSFGDDFLLNPDPPFAGVWVFSVDEFAIGLSHGVEVPSNVTTEGAAGTTEGAADVFCGFGPGVFPPGPLSAFPPSVPPPGNAVLIDGSGISPPAASHPHLPALLGIGLVEPNSPTSPPGPPPALPDPGDNLDALDVDTALTAGSLPFPIYFSLDSAFADPLESPPPSGMGPVNGGSAVANGFVGGDVLVVATPGSAPVLYAAANTLGLDYIGGPDSDDLDALVLWENGIPGYQPSINPIAPYDWGPGGKDMLLFSVRRGSATLGIGDTIFNLPIEEGDILVPPVGGGPGFPGIFIPAENLGLSTIRTAGVAPADDLDALDVSADCNVNAVPDRLEIVLGQAADANQNGVPDSCEAFCGDKDCAPAENPCTCANDCGPPPQAELPAGTCTDGLDNDCDGNADCLDEDCASVPSCGCKADPECDDADACTCDRCQQGACSFTAGIFGDVDCIGGNVDVGDVLCAIDGFGLFEACPNADIAPNCTGDLTIDVGDILAVIDAFAGIDHCNCSGR